MAYTIYVYLRPDVLNADCNYLKEYFLEQPWVTKPVVDPGFGYAIFVTCKPRYEEKGLTRFTEFMNALREVRDYIYVINEDDWVGRNLFKTMVDNGYSDLLKYLK